MKMKKKLRIFFYNLLFFFIFLIIIECFFGDWFKIQNWNDTLRSERSKKTFYSVKFKQSKYNFFYQENSLGFRGDEINPEKLKILMMGGSTVNQRFTPENLTIVGRLNEFLEKDDIDLKIYNGGIDGQSTIGLITNFTKWFPNIDNFKPKIILYYIGINERAYYDYNPNPENFTTGEFITNHVSDKMKENSIKERFLDYVKNNSFFLNKSKIIQLKYFPNISKKEKDYSSFKMEYNLNSNNLNKLFINQNEADKIHSYSELKKNNYDYYKSLYDRLNYLINITKKIDATPILITQVMLDGQATDFMYYTNQIIRQFCKENSVKLVDLAKIINFELDDFYDDVHTTPKGSKKIAKAIYPNIKKYIIETFY